MNKFIIGLIFFVSFRSFAHAGEPAELQRIEDLSAALQRGGLAGLSAFIKENQWQAPRMPSRWSVEHRPGSDEQQKVALAGREFGRKLAVQLDAIAPTLRDLPPGDELARTAHMLCDLSDWCASTPGYGNLFLAQRCLDLAAVGLARLIASLNFPLAACEKLAARMSPTWMSVRARAETLNDEAGTNLFAVGGTQTNMEKTWGSGGVLMREKRSGVPRPRKEELGRDFIDTPTLKANLDFFEHDELRIEPLTLVRSWDAKRYERIVNGLELRNVNKALALLQFRSVIGRFPEKPEFTEEELREHEQSVEKAAKHGITVSRMDEGLPLGKAAFIYAWDRRPGRNPKDHNLDARAWQAYNEVKTGLFLDEDTREERRARQEPIYPANR